MPVKAGDLEVVASLRDDVSGKLDKMEGKAGALAGKFAVAGAAVTAFAAVAGRDFDRAKTTIVQGTGATGEALDGLLATFQNLAGTISGADNQSVAGAVAALNTTFDVTGPALETIATKTLKAQQAFGEFDIPTFGRAMNVFGLETKDASGFLDHFGAVAQDTGVPMGTLIGQTQTFGPVMKNLGFNANDTATFFGKLNEAGVDVTRVMPGMNQAMRKAAKEGVTDLRGHIDGAIVSIREAETDTEALTIATETFGAEGAQRMTSAIRTGILPSLSELDSQYENTEGRTEAVYEATVTLGDRLAMLKDRALALVGPVGDAAAGLGSVATGAALVGPQIVSAGAAIGTKLLPLLSGPLGLVAVIGLAAIGIKKFYDSMARKEVDEFAESIEEMSDEVRDNTRAHLENVIAVSRARLENKGLQFAVRGHHGPAGDRRGEARRAEPDNRGTCRGDGGRHRRDWGQHRSRGSERGRGSGRGGLLERVDGRGGPALRADGPGAAHQRGNDVLAHPSVRGCDRRRDRPIRATRPGGVRAH